MISPFVRKYQNDNLAYQEMLAGIDWLRLPTSNGFGEIKTINIKLTPIVKVLCLGGKATTLSPSLSIYITVFSKQGLYTCIF